jgi:5-methylcytosine-specific restriction enzyme subunit McrC
VIRRTLFEWKSIAYGDDKETQIPVWAADRLAAVARKSPLGGESGGRILTHGRNALGAKQMVGIVVADNCTLEILPKIDVPAAGDEQAAQGLIRKKLIHLLAVAMDLDIDGGSVTELGWQKDNLLEILIRLFSLKLIDALRQGMPRRYVEREEDLATLRGRLDMTRQFSRLAANPARLACRFDELSPDIAINQIMRAAIDRLRRISQSPDNQRRLAELAFSYADITPMSPQALRWDEVQLDRTNARWKDLLALARLLLGERFQTTSVGEQAGFSLLFEMNTLFEEYVGRMLRRALAGSGLTVHLQGGRLFCLEEAGDGRRTFQTKPDILVRRGNEVVQIIDTKWKRIAARIDDPKQSVSQSDVYQMMAYGQLYECGLLTLLYPHHAALRSAPGVLGRYRVGTTAQLLHVASVDITDHRRVIGQLRALSSFPL